MTPPKCEKCGGDLVSVLDPETFTISYKCSSCEVEVKQEPSPHAVPRRPKHPGKGKRC